jgi:hypothetical protein
MRREWKSVVVEGDVEVKRARIDVGGARNIE